MLKDRDMKDFVELVGRKVTGFRWYDNIYTDLGWVDEMHNSIGKEGTILEYDSHDDSFRIEFENGDAYWHPAVEAVKHLVTQSAPVYDVNKTVEIIAPQSLLIEIMDISKMLSVLPYGGEDPLYTRPFIQDACYCAYGWTVAEVNDIINAAVKMNLFKLV